MFSIFAVRCPKVSNISGAHGSIISQTEPKSWDVISGWVLGFRPVLFHPFSVHVLAVAKH